MSDDQVACVSLVLAYPGCPGQKPLNGCVCVYFTLVELKHTHPDRQISCIVNTCTHENARTYMHTHTHNGPLSGITTCVSRYRKKLSPIHTHPDQPLQQQELQYRSTACANRCLEMSNSIVRDKTSFALALNTLKTTASSLV